MRIRTPRIYKGKWLDRNKSYPMWDAAKTRSKAKGIEFLIVLDDIVIPEFCPYLGIPITKSKIKSSDNSPTLDRIDSSKGYIPGNVEVISMRANVIKNSGTYLEHRMIADRLEGLIVKQSVI